MRNTHFFLLLVISVIPLISSSQPKSLRLSSTAGVNRYFGLKGAYNHPNTDYTWGNAITVEFGYISGTKYLPGQYAIGLTCDYFDGTFHEYGKGLTGIEYLNGKASKIMLGGYLIPMIFSVDEQLFISPGVEFTCKIKSDIDGVIRSDEGQSFGEMLPLEKDFAKKADFGVALNLEYLVELGKSNWYLCPRLKSYCSIYNVLTDMKSFRVTAGISIGYKLSEKWYPHGPTFFNER